MFLEIFQLREPEVRCRGVGKMTHHHYSELLDNQNLLFAHMTEDKIPHRLFNNDSY